MEKLLQFITYSLVAAFVVVLWIAIPMGRNMFACYERNTKDKDEIEISIRSVGWSREHACETKRNVIDTSVACLEENSTGGKVRTFLAPYVLRVVRSVRPGSNSAEDMMGDFNTECEDFPLMHFVIPTPAPGFSLP